jgi:hypothetical protein
LQVLNQAHLLRQFLLTLHYPILQILRLLGQQLSLLTQSTQNLLVVVFGCTQRFDLCLIFLYGFLTLLELFTRSFSPHTFDLVSDLLVGLLQFVKVKDDVFDQCFDLIHIFFQRVFPIFLLSGLFGLFIGCFLRLDEGDHVLLTIFTYLRDLFHIDLDFA